MEIFSNGMGDARIDLEHEVCRFRSELAFGKGLCDLNPRKADAWRTLMEKATRHVLDSANAGLPAFQDSVRRAEDLLTPLCEEAKKYTIYCVGHAHIDMNWMWSWPETVSVTQDTFTTVLRLMEEFPEFHFSQSQASVYAIIQEHRPDLLKQIRKRIKQGRWEVTASHWVEGDKNMAGAESLCRHILYTRQYMMDLFGLQPEEVPIDWSPDTFGHAITVPSYLTKGGVKYLYLHRPGAHGKPRPSAFWWKGPEGSRVLVRNDMALGYNGEIRPEMTQDLLHFAQETGLRFVMFVYGVGDHGGGPTRRDLLYAREMNLWPLFPNLELSQARTFYERLEREGTGLPLIEEELNLEFTGCFTSQSLIKKANRYGEKRLLEAESAATAATLLLNKPYPVPRILQGWKDTLFSHFHDILPGSGVRDTRTYTHGLYQKTMAMTGIEETLALRAIAGQVNTFGLNKNDSSKIDPVSSLQTSLGAGVGFGSVDGGISHADQSMGQGPRPFLFFNPLPFPRKAIIEVTLWENARGFRQRDLRQVAFVAEDCKGVGVKAQILDVGHYWGHQFVRLAFPCQVGPWGYSLVSIREGTYDLPKAEIQEPARQIGMQHHCGYSCYERSPEGLENELIRLELNPSTGGIRTLLHKASGEALIDSPREASPLEFVVERPHGMTSWLVDHTGPKHVPELLSIQRRMTGPHKASIDVRLLIRDSEFVLTYELRQGDPMVYVHLNGTWVERGTPQTGIPVLRTTYPFALTDAIPRYEIPFGALSRRMNHGEEVPALRWAMVTGRGKKGRAGCLLLNDSKHGHSFQEDGLRLTLIRSSYDPDPLPEMGQHEIHLALCPFAGTMGDPEAIRLGQTFEHDIRVVSTDRHEGSLPSTASLLSCSPSSAVLQALKKAEGKDGLILRILNPTDRGVTAKIRFDPKLLGKIKQAVEVDLMERPKEESSVKVEKDNRVSVPLPKRDFTSLCVVFR